MREVVVLVAMEGYSYEETAALTGTGMGTVKSRLNRARQKLKDKISHWQEHSPKNCVQDGEGKRRELP